MVLCDNLTLTASWVRIQHQRGVRLNLLSHGFMIPTISRFDRTVPNVLPPTETFTSDQKKCLLVRGLLRARL